MLRNISWNLDGKDEILQLNIIYNACAKTANYICEATNDLVRSRDINLTFPIEDSDLLSALQGGHSSLPRLGPPTAPSNLRHGSLQSRLTSPIRSAHRALPF